MSADGVRHSFHRHPRSRRGGDPLLPAFSLVEILVVVAVVAGLVALAFPVLAGVRAASQRAACASNLHQVGVSARLYGVDNFNYFGQGAYLNYSTPGNTYNGQTLPAAFTRAGFTNTFTIQPDHYLAYGYMPLALDYKGSPGSTAFNCPAVPYRVGHTAATAYGGLGNVESHYFFSSLLSNPGPTAGVNPKNNVVGPYRGDLIALPAKTFLAGDALTLADPTNPASPIQIDATFAATEAGQRSTCFGAMSTILGAWLDNPTPYHTGGPNGLCFDGHVQTVAPPTPDQRTALFNRLTADGTANQY